LLLVAADRGPAAGREPTSAAVSHGLPRVTDLFGRVDRADTLGGHSEARQREPPHDLRFPTDGTEPVSSLHRVTKLIDFCYGHRLLNYAGKCRHLHGHNGRIEIDIESDRLDHLGMVVDFGTVRDRVGSWVLEHLDHRMLLCRTDPVVPFLQAQGEPLFLMDDNPTAENIARIIYQQASVLGLPITEVRLWETVTSCASYRG